MWQNPFPLLWPRTDEMRASGGHTCRSDSHGVTWPLLQSDSPWPGFAGLQYSNITMWHSAQHRRHCVFIHTVSDIYTLTHTHTHKCVHLYFLSSAHRSAKSSFLATKHEQPPHTCTHTPALSPLRGRPPAPARSCCLEQKANEWWSRALYQEPSPTSNKQRC